MRKDADGKALKQKAKGDFTTVLLDVTHDASIAGAAKTVAKAVCDRGLAGLVNNAGIVVPGPLEFLPLEDLRSQIEINVIGQVAVTQAFLPLLRKGRGRIVNIGSIGGTVGAVAAEEAAAIVPAAAQAAVAASISCFPAGSTNRIGLFAAYTYVLRPGSGSCDKNRPIAGS